ncbi:oxidoreductase [Kineococcus rubinsiae]|uniref:oxidoreductase n=1 Tax=Kineococcus rubinsiae TaxID=2609562 RepID=UPI001430EF46|nr:oxidoreductase [Kineococcus rubinsiae]NIZ92427.1 SDR family NAD(P)-dependent oxidoreductase [Kineococcus rubinsiae]
MATPGFSVDDLPDQHGRTVVVTGASSGIGRSAARALAGAGARVVLAVRNADRGRAAAATMPGDTEVRVVDLADLASVRAFAAGWEGPLDVLVNNAGVMMVPLGRTADGFEQQIGTNHLGAFALTQLLLPHVTDRVVAVSSSAHRAGRVDLADLNWERRRYQRVAAYGQSKLANLLFTLELQRRLTAAGSGVRALAAHPGWASTGLQTRSENRAAVLAGRAANAVFAQSADDGALPTLFAATQDLPGGSYAGPGGVGEMRGAPTLVGRSRDASDTSLAKRLWTLSEELTGTAWPL